MRNEVAENDNTVGYASMRTAQLSCGDAKLILLASFSSEGGGPFLDSFVVFDIFTTGDKLFFIAKFGRNGGRYF